MAGPLAAVTRERLRKLDDDSIVHVCGPVNLSSRVAAEFKGCCVRRARAVGQVREFISKAQ